MKQKEIFRVRDTIEMLSNKINVFLQNNDYKMINTLLNKQIIELNMENMELKCNNTRLELEMMKISK